MSRAGQIERPRRSEAGSARNRGLILAACGFLVLLVLAYSNHFHNGFRFDDIHTIVNNLNIRDLGNLTSFFTDASTSSALPANQAYRPIVTLLNAIDYRLAGGLDPFYFHLSIFFWYVVQAVLLFMVIRNLLDKATAHSWNSWVALLITAFYTLHVANTETINYVISRSDSFSTLCVVASLLLFQVTRSRKLYLYLVPGVIGILTKQTGVMFAPLLFLYALLFEDQPNVGSVDSYAPRVLFRAAAQSLVKTLPAWVLAIGLFLFNQFYMTPASTVSSNAASGRLDYLTTQFWVVTHYLGNFLLPVRLSADPDFKLITSPFDGRILVGLLVTGMMAAAVLWAGRRLETRPIAYGILWFYVTLLPTSSLIPLYQIANDHRTFFPYIGLSLSLGWAVALLLIHHSKSSINANSVRSVVIGMIVLAIAGHAIGTHSRNDTWSSPEKLWRDVTLKSPHNGRGLMNYGVVLMGKGDFEGAREYFERALPLVPKYAYLHVNLALLENSDGNPEKAETYFRDALSYDSGNPMGYYFYGKWLNERGRVMEALEILEKGKQVGPWDARLTKLLESLTGAGGQPVNVDRYVQLSLEQYKNEQYRECVETCRQALEIQPESSLLYNNMCSCYNKLGEWDRAIEACQRALEIQPEFLRARANLEWARSGKAGG